jgi:hypothetical protein
MSAGSSYAGELTNAPTKLTLLRTVVAVQFGRTVTTFLEDIAHKPQLDCTVSRPETRTINRDSRDNFIHNLMF